MSARLFLLQRMSAAVLAPLVLMHLVLIVLAVRNGLSAGEILARTRGDAGWAAFYGLFVIAVAIHGAIGLRTILIEWVRLGQRAASGAAWTVGLILLALGLRAVWAVVGGAA